MTDKPETADDIRRRLHANPIYWIDKACQLTMAIDAGTIAETDPDYGYLVSERDEADAKVAEFVAAGAITKEAVEAERQRQMEQAK